MEGNLQLEENHQVVLHQPNIQECLKLSTLACLKRCRQAIKLTSLECKGNQECKANQECQDNQELCPQATDSSNRRCHLISTNSSILASKEDEDYLLL